MPSHSGAFVCFLICKKKMQISQYQGIIILGQPSPSACLLSAHCTYVDVLSHSAEFSGSLTIWACPSKPTQHLPGSWCPWTRQPLPHNQIWLMGLPGGSGGKDSACSVGDQGLIPGWGRSPGEGNGYPLQHSCLENSWTEEPDSP